MSPAAFLAFEILGGVIAILVATICTVLKPSATPQLWLIWAGVVFGFVTGVGVAVKVTWWLLGGYGA